MQMAIVLRGAAWRPIEDAGVAAGGSSGQGRFPVPPPTPGGGGKSGGLAWKGVGYISQPFKTTSSEQGVQEKQGGMIFEQVCKK